MDTIGGWVGGWVGGLPTFAGVVPFALDFLPCRHFSEGEEGGLDAASSSSSSSSSFSSSSFSFFS